MKDSLKISAAMLRPKKKRYSVAVEKNLSLRVHPSGVKSWVVRIPYRSRTIDKVLGRYPEISVRQARQLAADALKNFGIGSPISYTLRDAFQLWKDSKRGRIVSFADEEKRLSKHVMPKLGNLQLEKITAPVVVNALIHLDKEDKRVTLRRLLRRVREILDLAVWAGMLKANPIPNLVRIFPADPVKPMPSMSWQDLPEIFAHVQTANKKHQLLFLLSLLLLLRPKEIASLRWAWISGDTLTIPADVMKNRKIHRVPLCPFVLEVLEELKRESKRSAFVFHGLNPRKPISPQALAKWLHSQPFFKNRLVAHGLRSIGRSWLADNGIAYEVAEACLAHAVGSQVSKAYNRSDYFTARKEAMDSWADFVRACRARAMDELKPSEH